MTNAPAYFNEDHFKVGQKVTYEGFEAVIVRHYYEGMWEIRVPGGLTCVSGAYIVPQK